MSNISHKVGVFHEIEGFCEKVFDFPDFFLLFLPLSLICLLVDPEPKADDLNEIRVEFLECLRNLVIEFLLPWTLLEMTLVNLVLVISD